MIPTLASSLPAKLPSPLPIVVVVVVVLFVVSQPMVRRIARAEGDPRLVTLAMAALTLHFLGAVAQILVDNHVYHGIADFTGYVHQGAVLAGNFSHFDFTTKGADLHGIIGDGSVSIVTGVVYTIIGVNELGSFFVFGWFAWLGTLFFYRAFCVTFPEADHRRYALMLFLLPSLLFWASDVSKEALVMFGLGVAACGTARILARQRRGYLLVAVGTAMGVATRPNEFALLLGSFAVAMFFRRRDSRRQLRTTRRLGSFVFMAVILLVTGLLLHKFLRGDSSVSNLLNKTHHNNSGQGAGFGSSNVAYSSDPLYYPRDIYTVLFDPLPITAGSFTQLIAGGENTVILVLVLTSLRRLRVAFRAGRERPYVIVCGLYTAGFIYSFAALGNLGLIDRERTLLLPFLLVLLSIPVAPKRQPPRYPWEKPRLKRRERRLAASRAGFSPPRPP